MNALEVLNNIKSNSNLASANFRYCLVSSNKHPLKVDGSNARPNNVDDFVELSEIEKCQHLENYAGIGISIQASNVTAIDVDKCFSRPFDITSADERALDIIDMFIDDAYIEFSFSGKGLRVFYRQPEVEKYSSQYYTKNEQYGIEYYQPSCSYRYVTLTGMTIVNNQINSVKSFQDIIQTFLNKYMKRYVSKSTMTLNDIPETSSIEELMNKVKVLVFTNFFFQTRWFDTDHYLSNVPGKSRESHHDYELMCLIFEHLTRNRQQLKYVFEQSPYFKSKDYKHMQKWTNNDYRYFNFVFDRMCKEKGVK